ncbi:MAG: hypothetical protein ACTSVM_00340, partial [Candidatus Ranarchaeia archaeon]
MDTVRRLIPSVKDLLPAFNFLKNPEDTAFKDITKHHQQNETMNLYNSTLNSGVKNKMSIIYGSGFDTLETLKITSITSPHANWVHYIKGLWEDGEPIHSCPSTTCEYTDSKK